MSLDPKRILVIYDYRDYPKRMRVSIEHHLRALESSETKHDIYYYNSFDEVPSWLPGAQFDAAILHTTFLCFRWTGSCFYRWKERHEWIRELDCVKIAMPQDEYDHPEVLDEWLYDWGISVIFTNFDESRRKFLHPLLHDKVQFRQCLTGYISETTARQWGRKLRPQNLRPLDLVYRGRHLPYHFGHLGQLKHRLAEIVAPRAKARGLRFDISTRAEDVVLGDRWLEFLASSRAVIGSEGGSSVIDWRGEVKARIQAIQKGDPNLSFDEVSARMPVGWDSYRFLTITPRHFEAAITKTCQVLVEGHYDGILQPGVHYIPLKSDFSDVDEAMEKLTDEVLVQTIVNRTYEDIYLSGKYTYRHLAEEIEKVLADVGNLGPGCNREGQEMENEDAPSRAAESMERLLIVERHRSSLLEAKLMEATVELQQLRGGLGALPGSLLARPTRRLLAVMAAAGVGAGLVLSALLALLILILVRLR